MVSRAAALCGMDTELDAGAARDVLAQFGDYVTAAEWARAGLAFCYDSGILDQAELDIRPLEEMCIRDSRCTAGTSMKTATPQARSP